MSESDCFCSGKYPRRSFLQKLGFSAAAAGASGSVNLVALALGEEGGSGPIDCGPPPPARPQHRTGGESFPPLPLPVTPLRRTEKKRPPSPPALVGKAALGSIKWITRGGKRVQYRDWMTDPADVKTLLSWTADRLGINYRAIETDFQHFSFDPRELPALLLAGHNAFEIPEEVRPKLARFVMDGGTILADACCGWKDFSESFRREMELIFPQKPLLKLLPDNPVFASYYKLGDLTYKRADGSTFTEAPCLEGIDFGCRTGVIFSPRDLTCGWDGHEHPRGLRVVIPEARQVGANLITYILGTFQLGRFLSTTKVYYEAAAPTRDDFVFAQVIHDGDWDPDPSGVYNLLKFARDHSTLEVKFKRQAVRLKDPQAATSPLLYMTGHRDFAFSKEELAALQKYLKAGGLLLADACCGRLAFDRAFRGMIARMLPGAKLERLPPDHSLYHCHSDVARVDYTPRVREDFGPLQAPELEGVTLDGRLAVVYSRFDLGNGWEQFPHPYSYGYKDEDALKIGTNVLVYAVTH
ncbi:MAG: DUF4159 domain-containing protein [Pirellulales bacterium]|nr:DUF4159 domain-containing protein [Pirellulales bacterium]